MQSTLPFPSSSSSYLYSSTRKPTAQHDSRPAKRLPIGPLPTPTDQNLRRTKREGVIFSHYSCSSLASWQSINYTCPDLYPNLNTPSPSPSRSSYPFKPVNHPSNEPIFHFSPATTPTLIHVSLPGYPASTKASRVRPNLTIKVPSNDMDHLPIIITPAQHKLTTFVPITPASPTPTSPLTFAYPTPHALVQTHRQRRKKLDKLRRHLGENIPLDLVFSNIRFVPSSDTPRRPPIPRFLSPKRSKHVDETAKDTQVGTSILSMPSVLQFAATSADSSDEDTDDDDDASGSDYHTAPEAPGARVRSWQGMWNIDNIDHVRAALRKLKAR